MFNGFAHGHNIIDFVQCVRIKRVARQTMGEKVHYPQGNWLSCGGSYVGHHRGAKLIAPQLPRSEWQTAYTECL